MKQSVLINLAGNDYCIDPAAQLDISIPVEFSGPRLSAFGAPPATAEPFAGKEHAASVAEGAGYNCEVFTFSAHLHGTHTECVGHISQQPHVVQDCIGHPGLLPAVLVSIDPVSGADSSENYPLPYTESDRVITAKALSAALDGHPGWQNCRALVIRTLPNADSRKTHSDDPQPPAFLTNDAMQLIAGAGVEHLLLDVPSVDRLKDEGRLSNHHIFWAVEQGSNDVPVPSSKSITELIFVADGIADGIYILDLNIGNIRSDATPSRPVLYELKPL